MQSRTRSLIEQLLNTGTGFVMSLAVWEFIVKPVWRIETSFIQNFEITVLFTVVSVVRSYTWRRLFNQLDYKNYKKRSYDKDEEAGTSPHTSEDLTQELRALGC